MKSFRRFGPPAIPLGRYSTDVRFFAAVLRILILPAAALAIVGYRLWRRRRYGPARPGLVPDRVCIDSRQPP